MAQAQKSNELYAFAEKYAKERTENIATDTFSSYRDGVTSEELDQRVGLALVKENQYCIAHFLEHGSEIKVSVDRSKPEVSKYKRAGLEYNPEIGEHLENQFHFIFRNK